MTSTIDSSALEAAELALCDVPRTAYSVPHVYPSAAPAYTDSPMAARPPISRKQLRLYLHVPFCSYRCTFCYFAVRVGADDALKARYVDAVARELEEVPPGTPLLQLYTGGGTPTALSPDLLDRLLEAVFSRTSPSGAGVHTVETSPDTATEAHARVLVRHGIGRVSMGVQSLDGEILGSVHRKQTSDQVFESASLLSDAGLIVNIDLIYGLPGQTEASFAADLKRIADAGIPAVTFYSLRHNERTPVRRMLRPDERFDLAGLARWRKFVAQAAADHGYSQTRWHTFKRLDTRAKNHERLACFDGSGGYQLGVGVSARSHLGHTIYRNNEKIGAYLDRIENGQSPVEQTYALNDIDRKTQYVARTLGDGHVMSRADFAAVFGTPIEDTYGGVLTRLCKGGLIEDDGGLIALSEVGKLLYDLVTLAFYPPHAQAWLKEREADISDAEPSPAQVRGPGQR